MSAFTDLLERHVPYASQHRDNVLCLICLDPTAGAGDRRCGEFPSSSAWAAHVEQELRKAGLTVTRRAPDPQPDQGALI